MRILLVPYQGYDGAGVLHLHEFANRLADRGCSVLVMLPGELGTAEVLAEPPRYRLCQATFELGSLGPFSSRVVRSFQPDVIHLWTPRHLPARIGLEAWSSSRSALAIHYEDDEEFILEHITGNSYFSHDDIRLYRFLSQSVEDPLVLQQLARELKHPELRASIEDPASWRWLHPVLSPAAEKLADGMTVISPSYRQVLRRRFAKPTRIIFPGVDFDRFAPKEKPERLLAELGLHGRTVLLYSGTIAPFHDFRSFLEILPAAVRLDPSLVLVHVGENQVSDLTDEIVKANSLEPHVRFVGRVPHREMARYLRLADAFIASVRNDRFNRHRLPSKIPEYAALGRPMLVHAIGIGCEFEDPDEVIKTQSDSAQDLLASLDRLLGARESWEQMGRRLRAKARDLFDWERSTDALLEFYEEIRPCVEPPGLPVGPAADEAFRPRLEDLLAPSTRMPKNDQVPPALRRLVIFTDGKVGHRMAGTGIRYFELARALAPHCHVTLCQPPPVEAQIEGVSMQEWTTDDPDAARVLAAGADAILVHGFVLEKLPALKESASRLIVDLYCPWVFENLEIHRDRGLPLDERMGIHGNDLRVLLDQLHFGDYFLCASPRQRDWILGMATALGRIDPRSCRGDHEASDYVGVVPFGLSVVEPPDSSPPAIRGVFPGVERDDFVLLWGGGIWSWLDPRTLIEAMARVREHRRDIKLVFLSTRTAGSVIRMPELEAALECSERLGLTGTSVIFNQESYIPYEERVRYFLEADIGVSAHYPSLEGHFAFRTRILDYLAAGLPVLTTEGDHLSEVVAQRQLGRVLPFRDVAGWTEAILSLASNKEELGRIRARVLDTRNEFSWSTVARPLIEYLLSSRDAARLSAPTSPGSHATPPSSQVPGHGIEVEDALAGLKERVFWLEHKVQVLRSFPLARPVWRLLRRLRGTG